MALQGLIFGSLVDYNLLQYFVYVRFVPFAESGKIYKFNLERYFRASFFLVTMYLCIYTYIKYQLMKRQN